MAALEIAKNSFQKSKLSALGQHHQF